MTSVNELRHSEITDAVAKSNLIQQKFKIHLWGPPTLDWLNAAEPDVSRKEKTFYPLSRQSDGSGIHSHVQLGGVALVENLLKAILPDDNWEINISGMTDVGDKYTSISLPTGQDTSAGQVFTPSNYYFYRHNYTLWKNFETRQGEPAYFRMSEWTDREFGNYTLPAPQFDSGFSHIVMIDDPSWSHTSIDDRSHQIPELAAAREKTVVELSNALSVSVCDIDHIVVRTASHNSPSGLDITQTSVLQMFKENALNKNILDKTTILTSLRDLRTEACRIEISLSWEKMFYEVVDAVEKRFFKQGINVRRVIVTIGLCGVIVIHNVNNHRNASLIFDQRGQEGDFEQTHTGFVLGYTTCMLSALCTELIRYPVEQERDWLEASGQGLRLMRSLHIHGFELKKKVVSGSFKRYHLEFPAVFLSASYNEATAKFDKRVLNLIYSSAPPVPSSALETAKTENGYGVVRDFDTKIFEDSLYNAPAATTILIEKANGFKQGVESRQRRKLVFDLAKMVVREGSKKALVDVPMEIVEGWRSADKNEIEGIRSVKNAMRKYIGDQQRSKSLKPISVAIFGPPGAGKSYVVKQIAASLGIKESAFLSFNLSQYRSTDELAKAFHQIRDLHLRGELPVSFWDEFDSPLGNMPLGWLTSFLSPMQDGEFTESGRVHPIGSGIHIFAGGTSPTFQKFCEGASENDKVAKKPDFISRLSTYVNVKGPNGDPNAVEDKSYMIRRAFLLHSFLNQHAKHLAKGDGFDVEDGVLNAFLRTTYYTNGSRSMEALVKSSDLRGKSKFELSSLPPDHIISMYVEANDFRNLAAEDNTTSLRERVGVFFDPSPELSLGNQDFTARQSELRQRLDVPVSINLLARLSNEEELSLIEYLYAEAITLRAAPKLIAVLPVARSYYLNTPDDFIQHLPARLRLRYLYRLICCIIFYGNSRKSL